VKQPAEFRFCEEQLTGSASHSGSRKLYRPNNRICCRICWPRLYFIHNVQRRCR